MAAPDHLAPYPFPVCPRRIHPPDAEREPMDATIQAFEGFGLNRYVGAVTFRARDAQEAAYLHLLVKIDDFAKEGEQGREWYERLLYTLQEPLHWSEEPRIQTGERRDGRVEPSPEGYVPHPTNHQAFTRKVSSNLPKPVESKRFPLAEAKKEKPKTKSAIVVPKKPAPQKAAPAKPAIVIRAAAKKKT